MQRRGSATVSHADAYVACCEAGLGFIQLPRYHVERQLAEGRQTEGFDENPARRSTAQLVVFTCSRLVLQRCSAT